MTREEYRAALRDECRTPDEALRQCEGNLRQAMSNAERWSRNGDAGSDWFANRCRIRALEAARDVRDALDLAIEMMEASDDQ